MSTVEQAPPEQWTFPTNLEPGMRVLVSTDPTFINPCAGILAGIEHQSAYIFMMAGDDVYGPRAGMLMDCWHKDDPRVKRQPELINEGELRGIFCLAESEYQIQQFSEQFKLLETSVEDFLASNKKALSDLKETISELQERSGEQGRKVDQLEARLKKLESKRS